MDLVPLAYEDGLLQAAVFAVGNMDFYGALKEYEMKTIH